MDNYVALLVKRRFNITDDNDMLTNHTNYRNENRELWVKTSIINVKMNLFCLRALHTEPIIIKFLQTCCKGYR